MKNQQKTKKHHFVPECYLKNFIKNSTLFTLDIRKVQKGFNTKVKPSQPGMICYLEDYYKINEDDPNNSQFQLTGYDELFVETDLLYSYELRYNKLLHAIIFHKELSRSQAIEFSDFIVQIKLRNPFWLENTIEKNKDQWIDSSMDKIIGKYLGSDSIFPNIPSNIKKLVLEHVRKDNKDDSRFGKKMQLFGLIQRYSGGPERNLKLRKAILNGSWTLLKAPEEGPYFITSDNPGFSTTDEDDLTYNSRFENGFYFHFPLSHSYCLVISDHASDQALDSDSSTKFVAEVQINSVGVIEINNRVIQIINKLLIGSDDWYLSQIAVINKPKQDQRTN